MIGILGCIAKRSAEYRYCGCGVRLALDNQGDECSLCARRPLDGPPEVPASFWTTDHMRDALANRHMGEVIAAYRTHPHHRRTLPQELVGHWAGMSQGQVSRIENGPPLKGLDALILWARTLRIPRDLLWFDLPPNPSAPSPGYVHPNPQGGDPTPQTGVPTAAALTAQDLAQIAAAMDNGRYVDASIITALHQQLVASTATDGEAGAQRSLPQVLGIVAVVEQQARETPPGVRQDLLIVGAHGAEFAGWLYRDIGHAALADHWRDRAMEWAAEAGDLPMCGYILLKKAQAAWDNRDAAKMLSLAQAAQQPTWNIPRQVRAEAAQQEARGHAMTGGDHALIEAKLDEAHTVADAHLTPDPSADAGARLVPGGHYSVDLLTMQTAICWVEAGQPIRAVKLYRSRLDDSFSPRDRGYFMSLLAGALARANEPHEAATTALDAMTIARSTASTRTMAEVRRTAAQLSTRADLPAVRDLHDAMASQT